MPILLVFALLASSQAFAGNSQTTCNKGNDICLILPNEAEIEQPQAITEVRSMLLISDIIPDEYTLKELNESFQNEALNSFKNEGLPKLSIKTALSIERVNNHYLRNIRYFGRPPALIPTVNVSKTGGN